MVASIPPEDQFTRWRSEYESGHPRLPRLARRRADVLRRRLVVRGVRRPGVGHRRRVVHGGLLGHGRTPCRRTPRRAGSRSAAPAAAAAGRRRARAPRRCCAPRWPTASRTSWPTCSTKAEEILRENRLGVLALAHALETHKTLSGEDVEAVLEQRIGISVDGTVYGDSEFAERLEDYHAAAAGAHVGHTKIDGAMPEGGRLAPPPAPEPEPRAGRRGPVRGVRPLPQGYGNAPGDGRRVRGRAVRATATRRPVPAATAGRQRWRGQRRYRQRYGHGAPGYPPPPAQRLGSARARLRHADPGLRPGPGADGRRGSASPTCRTHATQVYGPGESATPATGTARPGTTAARPRPRRGTRPSRCTSSRTRARCTSSASTPVDTPPDRRARGRRSRSTRRVRGIEPERPGRAPRRRRVERRRATGPARPDRPRPRRDGHERGLILPNPAHVHLGALGSRAAALRPRRRGDAEWLARADASAYPATMAGPDDERPVRPSGPCRGRSGVGPWPGGRRRLARPTSATTPSCSPTATRATWSTPTATGAATRWPPTWPPARTRSTSPSRTSGTTTTSAPWCARPTRSARPGVHIVGRRRWNRRGAMVTDRYLAVHHHDDVAGPRRLRPRPRAGRGGGGQHPGRPAAGDRAAAPGLPAAVRPGRPRRDRRGAHAARRWSCRSPSSARPARSTRAWRPGSRCTPGSASTPTSPEPGSRERQEQNGQGSSSPGTTASSPSGTTSSARTGGVPGVR